LWSRGYDVSPTVYPVFLKTLVGPSGNPLGFWNVETFYFKIPYKKGMSEEKNNPLFYWGSFVEHPPIFYKPRDLTPQKKMELEAAGDKSEFDRPDILSASTDLFGSLLNIKMGIVPRFGV